MAASKKTVLDRLISGDLNIFNPKTYGFSRFKNYNPAPDAIRSGASGDYREFYTHSFTGEKDSGEIGPLRNYALDYHSLRIRSWQSYLESETAQTIIRRLDIWVIGKGLKLQSEPETRVLKLEGINLDKERFSQEAEARFNLWRRTKSADYRGMKSLDKLSSIAFKNAKIGGDILVVLRLDKKDNPTVQLIDGAHIQSPVYGTEGFPQTLPNGYQIKNGIEVDQDGQHVAYWVKQGLLGTPKRIAARGEKTGMLMAWMVYGLDYRLDNMRGMPLLTAVLETIAKLERYKEATLGSAEEQAKIALQVVHNVNSTGTNPFANNILKAHDADAQATGKDSEGKELATNIALTTKKQAFNNPPGSEVKPLNPSTGQNVFKDFYSAYTDSTCATVGIPPNVAMQKYDTSFSSARAALKDWENSLFVERDDWTKQFYQPIYDFWLYIQILLGKINAPGYLLAKKKGNNEVIDAYNSCRFVGVGVPHIDPLKEVKAEREKLGSAGAHLPLTTQEAATEALGGGEANSNTMQYARELEEAETLEIPVTIAGNNPDSPPGEDSPPA